VPKTGHIGKEAVGSRWGSDDDADRDADVETRSKGTLDKIMSQLRGGSGGSEGAGRKTNQVVVADRKSSPVKDSEELGIGAGADSDAVSRQSSVPSGDGDDVSGAIGSDDEDTGQPESLTQKKDGPYLPSLKGCRSVEAYLKLNAIAEGTYGKVFRAKSNDHGRVVALKQIKMGKDGAEGFPITALREIDVLLKLKHPNIVEVAEVVTGSDADKVFMVMEYMEHDLKSLMGDMRGHWSAAEVKCLMRQLLDAMHYCHDNWIIHRDIKTSNLLLNNEGILKVCDFGLARPYGDPIRGYTQLVVTLWYRSPELLLGCKEYAAEVDVWSVGCVFAEFLNKEPLFMGKGDTDQLDRIFKVLGVPDEMSWPGVSSLPGYKKMRFTKNQGSGLRKLFPVQNYTGGPYLTENGLDLLARMLELDPKQRITCEDALNHAYFHEAPSAKDPAMMPTFPSSNEGKRVKHRSPQQMFAHNAPKTPDVNDFK